MLSYLKGKIKNKGKGYVILDTGGVGYGIYVNPVVYADLSMAEDVEMYIHEHVRENAIELYGFRSMAELEMFELLLTISGVGPKSALGITSIADSDEIKSAIAAGDPSLLTKVSGIGRKTAERIVLELREKIASLSGYSTVSGMTGASGDEIDALQALGYSLAQARDALKKVDTSVKDSGERIREALRNIK